MPHALGKRAPRPSRPVLEDVPEATIDEYGQAEGQHYTQDRGKGWVIVDVALRIL